MCSPKHYSASDTLFAVHSEQVLLKTLVHVIISQSVVTEVLRTQTDRFVLKNIPYFLSKVNALYRSLIFFEHIVHFQHCFFGKNNIIQNTNFKKLQNGKSQNAPYFILTPHLFYAYCPTITNSAISATCFCSSFSINKSSYTLLYPFRSLRSFMISAAISSFT